MILKSFTDFIVCILDHVYQLLSQKKKKKKVYQQNCTKRPKKENSFSIRPIKYNIWDLNSWVVIDTHE